MESIKNPTLQIRSQLEILLHCKKCLNQSCSVQQCSEFKNVILHMNVCKEGRACQGVHCASSSQILRHWDTCQNEECVLCSVLRETTRASVCSPEPNRTNNAALQNWLNNSCENTDPAQDQNNYSQNGEYFNSNRTDNLSDEMKLAIRDAVQASMNGLIPQLVSTIKDSVQEAIQASIPQFSLENMIRSTIRSEVAGVLQAQNYDLRQTPPPPQEQYNASQHVTSPTARLSKPPGAMQPGLGTSRAQQQQVAMTTSTQQQQVAMTTSTQQQQLTSPQQHYSPTLSPGHFINTSTQHNINNTSPHINSFQGQLNSGFF